MQVTPNYPGDETAAKILKRADCYFELGSLKALMAGALLGHSLVKPFVILDYIEFAEIAQPDFGDKKLAQDFLSTFFGLWNHIADHRNPGKPFSFSQPDASWKMDDTESWLQFAELMEFEVGEFLVGAEFSETPTLANLENISGVNPSNYLPHLIAIHLGSLEKEHQKLKENKSQDARAINKIVQAIDHDLKKHHSKFLEIMAMIEVVPEPIISSSPKTGRNEPCPCGSGKKFKQCCLQ